MLTQITSDHLNLFLELKNNNPGQWKMGHDFTKEVDPTYFFNEALIHPKFYTVGWIEDNKLLSIASMFEFTHMAAWTIYYISNVKTEYNSLTKTHSGECLSELIQESLRRKLTTSFSLVREKFPTTDYKMQKKWIDATPELDYYYWVDECKIPANTLPKYDYIKWIMNHRPWPVDLKVRMGMLKKEYREQFNII